ncbi:TolC family protein [Parabacteroides sp. AM58-2XD]|uniref:TolC family protein n=1 Tax=Parabacteroides TaxID=375288 RepID=UPI000FE261C8|nr:MULTISPECIES: TolC family protein [Parabacteroides]MCM0720297.1 TolC family protein [Parabacteroides sp. W1-Q-101]RGY92287.1 TolC family protein [Parabacteroides sp. AM58-2XD]GKG74621.1 transporter [Parabacteroides goldsteinii]GKG81973.1 transporter [Parabacteroides goldsteinii]
MKQFIVITLLASAALSVNGQNSIDAVLRSIEANNKELQANNQLTVSKKLEAKLDNNLPDPSVSYVHQYGNREGMGIQGELVASQSFDFPSVYVQKNKLAKSKAASFDRQGAEFRQQILLQAKEICLDLVLLNQQRALLDQRRQNAEQLAELYAMRLETGDANILETNKIDLELLNAKTEARMNESARIAKLQELATLNGGIAIDFTDTTYMSDGDILSFEELRAEAVTSNPQLLTLKSEQVAARRQLSVNKSKSLPGFELGYRMNTATGGERFNGFLVGVSIPLFSNRNNVKQAKAQALYTDLQLESTTTTVESELHQLYNQSVALKTSMDEYNTVLKSQNSLALLNKAIQTGQISMIEYFVDVTTFYQSMQNYMQLQNEYQKVMAQLYKYKL